MPRANRRQVGNATWRVAQWSMFAVVLWATSSAAGIPADLTKLQSQVAEWRQHATREGLDDAAAMEAFVAECTADAFADVEPEDLEYGTDLRIDDDEYHYTSVEVAEKKFCLFMSRPLHRVLSLAEAIVVQDAQVMLRTWPVKPKVYSSEETKAAENDLAELLAAVRSGTHAPVDKAHPPSPLDQVDLADCSDFDPHNLTDAYGESQFIFHSYYNWVSVPREHGKRCIYLKAPFNRGLNAADASDFLMAPHLRLTQAAADTPNLERMVKAALERFDADAGLPSDPRSKDLIDCQKFDPNAQDNDGSFSSGGARWIFDGMYAWYFYYFPKGTCVAVSGEEETRGLTAKEARAFLRAARAGIDDPRDADVQRADNCLQKASQSDNANIPAYESGTINGRRCRVFYAGLDADLEPLDEAQHAFVASRKEVWRRSAPLTTHHTESAFDTEIRISGAGRTSHLEALSARESAPDPRSPSDAGKYWLLHVPSGRLLTFEDLFVDPKLVHAQIVARTLRHLLDDLDREMPGFVGDNAEQQAEDYRALLHREGQRIVTTPTEHFVEISVGVFFSENGKRKASISGGFSSELLPGGVPLQWGMGSKDLGPFFKPEFRDVLDGMNCPPTPAVPQI